MIWQIVVACLVFILNVSVAQLIRRSKNEDHRIYWIACLLTLIVVELLALHWYRKSVWFIELPNG